METIPKKLREGILYANNISTLAKVDENYTTFVSDRGKSSYATEIVKGVAEYMAGKIPKYIDPILGVASKLSEIKEVYNLGEASQTEEKKPDYYKSRVIIPPKPKRRFSLD